jgi:hypothetical protein
MQFRSKPTTRSMMRRVGRNLPGSGVAVVNELNQYGRLSIRGDPAAAGGHRTVRVHHAGGAGAVSLRQSRMRLPRPDTVLADRSPTVQKGEPRCIIRNEIEDPRQPDGRAGLRWTPARATGTRASSRAGSSTSCRRAGRRPTRSANSRQRAIMDDGGLAPHFSCAPAPAAERSGPRGGRSPAAPCPGGQTSGPRRRGAASTGG